jgi:2-dehydro-3-deoxygluconokinase
MSKVLCLGELLLRLSPQLNQQWIREATMPVYVGGAELNAATALARWGVPVTYCTALPDNYLSREIIASVKERNIETNTIVLSGDRIGIYYLPQGLDLKNAGVIYDRANSSFATLKPGQIDWDKVLKGVSWFHFSAINPALNEQAATVCKEALQMAVQKNIFTSVDLNYRAKLWQYGKAPAEVMPELVQYCDLVMGNIWAAEKMLDISLNLPLESKEAYLQQAEWTSQAIVKQFPKCRQVANTFRFEGDTGLTYFATLFKNNQFFVSSEYTTSQVVDKVGSGDCFMAGLIYGNRNQLPDQEIIDFAAAAAYTKLFIKGDATTVAADEIKKAYTHYA